MWRTLAEFTTTGENAMAERIVQAVSDLDLPPTCLERFKAVVAEAVHGARQHGDAHPVSIRVLVSDARPAADKSAPGRARPGWGFFSTKKVITDWPDAGAAPQRLEIEIFLYQEEELCGA